MVGYTPVGDSDESPLVGDERNFWTKSTSMTMASVVLIHLLLICPLIRLLSVWMQTDAKRQSSRRQRGVKVLRGGVKRTLRMWRAAPNCVIVE